MRGDKALYLKFVETCVAPVVGLKRYKTQAKGQMQPFESIVMISNEALALTLHKNYEKT